MPFSSLHFFRFFEGQTVNSILASVFFPSRVCEFHWRTLGRSTGLRDIWRQEITRNLIFTLKKSFARRRRKDVVVHMMVIARGENGARERDREERLFHSSEDTIVCSSTLFSDVHCYSHGYQLLEASHHDQFVAFHLARRKNKEMKTKFRYYFTNLRWKVLS